MRRVSHHVLCDQFTPKRRCDMSPSSSLPTESQIMLSYATRISKYCAQIAESAASENTQIFIATRRRAAVPVAQWHTVRGDSARRREAYQFAPQFS